MGTLDPDSIAGFVKTIQTGLVTMVGGVMGHVIDIVHTGKEWTLWGHIAIAFVSFLVGQLIGDLMPDWIAGKYGIMMMTGTISAPLYKRAQLFLMQRYSVQMRTDDVDRGAED